jgi:hypothetical protein
MPHGNESAGDRFADGGNFDFKSHESFLVLNCRVSGLAHDASPERTLRLNPKSKIQNQKFQVAPSAPLLTWKATAVIPA